MLATAVVRKAFLQHESLGLLHRRIETSAIAKEVGISKASVLRIIYEELEMNKALARCC